LLHKSIDSVELREYLTANSQHETATVYFISHHQLERVQRRVKATRIPDGVDR